MILLYTILCICYIAHSTRLSRNALLSFVDQLAPTWYELGVELLEVGDEMHLTMIGGRHGSNKWKCCLAMLNYWMKTYPKATWHDLVTALKSPGVELTAVASDIEKKFTGKTLLCTHVRTYVRSYTVRGKILEGENFGESLLMKQMARKILANLLAGLQLFHCI